LTLRLDQYEEAYQEGRIMSKEHKKSMDTQHERLSKLEEKFDSLTAKFDTEILLDREFELKTDPIKKDQIFELKLQATRDRIRKEGECERAAKKQLQKNKQK
jgi:hypothetical protein